LKKKIEIFCTLGPSTLNKDFLKFSNKKVSLLRLNMSHIKIKQLESTIKFIRKFSKVPICIDTEGAQIRSKVIKKKNYKYNNQLIIFKNKGNFKIYPPEIFNKLKKNDSLNIGFDGLEIKIIKILKDKMICKTLKSGLLENNKGVHLINRNMLLNFVTKKDEEAIKIAKSMNIKYFALSFTNTSKDIVKFNKLLKNKIKIFKLETKMAIKNLNKIISTGNNFLIDRGDLSKDVSIEMIPVVQRKILRRANLKNKKVYVATNFLESMINNSYATRGETNDIYNTLEMGASGIVLAAETAIGKYPKECITFLKKIIKVFKQNR
jgi:pyruvate kinase